MKKFLCFVASLVVIAVIVSNKTEILQAVDDVFGSETVVDWEVFSTQESQHGSAYKNHFSSLNDNQKKAYNHILDEIFSAEYHYPEMIEVPYMSGEQLTEVVEAVNYDNPTVMCIGRDNTIITTGDLCYLKPNYTMSPSEQRVKTNTLNNIADSILATIPQEADQFKTELYIHDYIVNNCTYDKEVALSSSTPYSCLVDKLSACEGYSKATKFLLEKAGIEAYTVSGKVTTNEKTEGHMWNIVRIDGSYYHLDVTWDDPTNPDGKECLSHLFVNLSDKDIGTDHFDYQQFFDCSDNRANYFVRQNLFFENLDKKTNNRLKKLISSCEGSHLEIRFADKKSYDSAFKALITDGKIYSLIDSANKTYGSNISTKSVSYIENQDRNCIDLYFI